MPLVIFDIVKGRSADQIAAMLDAAHAAMLESFGVPARDRYQIVNEHDRSHLMVQDTGLGIERTRDVTIVRVITRPRTKEQKTAFYRVLTQRLQAHCGIARSDVVISRVVNDDEDWSFGQGRAQFLTGEL
jgi:hypothetical protein